MPKTTPNIDTDLNSLVFSIDDEDIVITGSHPLFNDTPLEGKNFTVTIRPPSQKDLENYRRIFHIGTKKSKDSEYSKKIFMTSVINWTGLNSPKGEIVYSEENKEKVYEKVPMFGTIITGIAMSARIDQETEEKKN